MTNKERVKIYRKIQSNLSLYNNFICNYIRNELYLEVEQFTEFYIIHKQFKDQHGGSDAWYLTEEFDSYEEKLRRVLELKLTALEFCALWAEENYFKN